MGTLVKSVELRRRGYLAASPEHVWALLSDPEGFATWLDDVSHVVAKGDRFWLRRGGDAGKPWMAARVIAAEPARRLRWRAEKPGSVLREVMLEARLAPDAEGTAFELVMSGLPTCLGAVARPLVRFRAEIALTRALRGLRSALDARRSEVSRRGEGQHPLRPSGPASRAASAAG